MLYISGAQPFSAAGH